MLGRSVMTELKPMSNDQKIEAINYWQDKAYVHPLTCGNDSNHAELRGRIETQDDGVEVVLYCPDCDYTQEWVPEVVYKLWQNREEYESRHAFMGFKKDASNREIPEGKYPKEDRYDHDDNESVENRL